jgi:long-subunit fatty acid transport protein
MRVRTALGALILAEVGRSSVALGSNLQLIGVTPRAMALGGAYTAAANDAASTIYNPAGLVRVEGSLINLSFHFSFPNLSAELPDGTAFDTGAKRDEGYALHLAWSPTSILDGDLGIGFSVMLPHTRALRFAVHRFEEPYHVLYENSIDLLQIRAGLAYNILKYVSVGVSAMLLAGLNGLVTLEAPFQDADDVDESKRTVLEMQAVLPNRAFFAAGVQVYPVKGLTLGVAYQQATFVPIQLPIDFTIEIVGIRTQTVANLDVKVKYTPDQLVFGAAYEITDSLLVTTDLAFARYAKYELPSGIVGLERGVEGIVLLPPRQPRTDQRNLWIPRVGVEWSPIDLVTLRVGYYFFRSFIRGSDAPILDSDKHSVNLGVAYALGNHFLGEGQGLDIVAAGQALIYSGGPVAGHDHGGQVFSTTFGAELRY